MSMINAGCAGVLIHEQRLWPSDGVRLTLPSNCRPPAIARGRINLLFSILSLKPSTFGAWPGHANPWVLEQAG